MKIGVNCGHTLKGPGSGAVGIINESEQTRAVGYTLMDMFRCAGVDVVDCTINNADTRDGYLQKAVEAANREDLDWFISIHFNASASHQGNGVEVYTYEGRRYEDALEVCKNLSDLGFKNRGVKAGSGLYVIRKTKAKSMLIEVCFCDNEYDVSTYLAVGKDEIALAIYNALCPYVTECVTETAIMGQSAATKEQLNTYLINNNSQAHDYLSLAEIFLEEGEKEGVRGDVAYCQSCKETGFFKFGGDVRPEQHNYAGLGATGGVPGPSFPDIRTGIRAQIQHLKAYASTQALNLECVDPRYKYVNKGCAPTVEQLGGKWAVPGYSGYKSLEEARAAKDSYGDHIVKMLGEVLQIDISQKDMVDEMAPDGKLWVVQLGAYKSRNNAEEFIEMLKSKGIVARLALYDTE